jgi:hypothetical protein
VANIYLEKLAFNVLNQFPEEAVKTTASKGSTVGSTIGRAIRKSMAVVKRNPRLATIGLLGSGLYGGYKMGFSSGANQQASPPQSYYQPQYY